ncbi:ORF49 [Vibrio phage VHML]|uniref:ORF49 n=1 Tax=Vibrio phage VHML TaxID=207597 RepID=Q8H9L8_9CAUD|nr:ORF49 [Vibrio phage VHML]AAN12348.1 ORF49 [Vibrio phage VHML]
MIATNNSKEGFLLIFSVWVNLEPSQIQQAVNRTR